MRKPAGRGSSRSVISSAIPKRPSEPTKPPTRSGPTGSRLRPPSVTSVPSASTALSPRTWFSVMPWRKQWAPPELKATLPPIVQIAWLDGSGA